MPKYIVELHLDGYETDEEMEAACDEFIEDQLDITAGGVTITKIEEKEEK